MTVTENQAIRDIRGELARARHQYPDFPSAMHGIGVLREEFEELWELIRAKDDARDKSAMYYEASQVAAMAIRFMLDCCERPELFIRKSTGTVSYESRHTPSLTT